VLAIMNQQGTTIFTASINIGWCSFIDILLFKLVSIKYNIFTYQGLN